ncbi:hypothetical protein CK203_007032 [Vitis vinifera]|uniref:F-box domain-containing protein n=1 Tax=Vitis vinifera TaxID=29760 RepID=A0A438KBY4_VITVI|nr:hypothetical protein CK203_007032 [Vitis vinifera]
MLKGEGDDACLKVRNPERKNVEESHMDEIETKSWLDLPQDLIFSMMERLYVADRVRLRAVCKDWHLQPNRGIKAIDKLPWTMEYKWRNPKSISFWSVCKLYEPLHHNRRLSYMVEKGRMRGRKNFAKAETHDLVANDHPLGTLKAVGYMEGTFYCHFSSFHLAAFNIVDQELSLVMTTCPAMDHLDDSLFNYFSRSYLLECEGDLLLAGGACDVSGETSFYVSAGGETEIIANRIYYHHDGVPEFQTLDLCSFDEYDSRDHDYLTWQKEKKREAGNAKIYGYCRKSLKTIWIQPPQDS